MINTALTFQSRASAVFWWIARAIKDMPEDLGNGVATYDIQYTFRLVKPNKDYLIVHLGGPSEAFNVARVQQPIKVKVGRYPESAVYLRDRRVAVWLRTLSQSDRYIIDDPVDPVTGEGTASFLVYTFSLTQSAWLSSANSSHDGSRLEAPSDERPSRGEAAVG